MTPPTPAAHPVLRRFLAGDVGVLAPESDGGVGGIADGCQQRVGDAVGSGGSWRAT